MCLLFSVASEGRIRNLGLGGKIGTFLGPFWYFGPIWDQVPNSGPYRSACIPRHAGGKDAALDVTVVNPLQAALVSQAAETPGHALKVAHKRKLDKSWQACNQQGIVFLIAIFQ